MGLIERRVALLLVLFLAGLALAAGRTAYFGAVRGGSLSRVADAQQARVLRLPAPRGTISDRRGVELAVSEPADDVSANPRLIRDPRALAERLAPLLERDVATLATALADRRRGFVYLRRQLPSRQARAVRAMEVEGLDLSPSSRRVYPHRALAAQLLGFVGVDGKGLAGIEHSLNRPLQGQDGERRVVNDALGQAISLRDERTMRPGRDVQLTIDSAIQDRTERVLAELGRNFSPKGATALVMDPRTGALLALANWPSVDANQPQASAASARIDHAVSSAYEPGSTFKPFTVAGALERGLVTPQTSFNLAPQIQVADRTIGEAHERGWATLTTAQILAQSSNVGAITIGQRLGAGGFDSWVRRFGFGRLTGIDVPGEGLGIVPGAAEYSGASMGNLPIGQGLAVTPLQMATAYAALANGGWLPTPHVVARVDGKARPRPRARRVLSARTAAAVREMLEGVLAAGGTASEVSISGYRLAGKTGTANKPDPVYGGYSQTRYYASFVGFAPARRPRLLVAVMADEPQGEVAGGVVAAPAFRDIASFALTYLRIAPDDPEGAGATAGAPTPATVPASTGSPPG
jgi:cell division protein FtsI (penicillin-binding protein 3)